MALSFGILDKVGFLGTLTKNLKVSFAYALSRVLLNGILTHQIPLPHSVRQGCPLSPLFFILAFDVLNLHLNSTISENRSVGVQFLEVSIHNLHNM